MSVFSRAEHCFLAFLCPQNHFMPMDVCRDSTILIEMLSDVRPAELSPIERIFPTELLKTFRIFPTEFLKSSPRADAA
jgi:hypothetical protein